MAIFGLQPTFGRINNQRLRTINKFTSKYIFAKMYSNFKMIFRSTPTHTKSKTMSSFFYYVLVSFIILSLILCEIEYWPRWSHPCDEDARTKSIWLRERVTEWNATKVYTSNALNITTTIKSSLDLYECTNFRIGKHIQLKTN